MSSADSPSSGPTHHRADPAGLVIAALVTMALRTSLANVAPSLAVSPDIALMGIGLMIALGVITGIIPALNAMRLKIAAALGRG